MSYSVYYINTSEIPNHFTLLKGAIYYVTITTAISSHVKITRYLHVWRYEVFTGKLTWYFTGVYIINKSVQGLFIDQPFTPPVVFLSIRHTLCLSFITRYCSNKRWTKRICPSLSPAIDFKMAKIQVSQNTYLNSRFWDLNYTQENVRVKDVRWAY